MTINELFLWCKHLRSRVDDASTFWSLDAGKAVRLIQSCGEDPAVVTVVDAIRQLDAGTLIIGELYQDPIAALTESLGDPAICKFAIALRDLDTDSQVVRGLVRGMRQTWVANVKLPIYEMGVAVANHHDILVLTASERDDGSVDMIIAKAR